LKKVVFSNYKLQLPKIMKLKLLVFYILLFELVFINIKLDIIVKVELNKGEFEIETILDLYIIKRQLEYFIK